MNTTRIILRAAAEIAPVRRRLFGSFVEHLGRSVYGGIYEPGHPTADGRGFRSDVKELIRELGVSTLRYPGGNFVSGYRWEDGVGPKESRPVRRDLAWHSLESNQVGTDEFAGWCTDQGIELILAANLATRGIEAALDLLEYVNGDNGTALSDLRSKNGSPEPHGVTMWCLGNEMDGPWQVGHMSADKYGLLAARTAAAMKRADSSLELVACGSSYAAMPTFGEWERTVLEHTWDHIDYLSCHAYYEPEGGDIQSFLASPVDMDAFITGVAAVIDHVKAMKRSSKDILISFDEWNVWYGSRWSNQEQNEMAAEQSGATRPWPLAPALLEDTYDVIDGVVVGGLLISLLRNSDRVGSANLAQLVNVIAPIRTEPGGVAWKQTTFHPFALTSRLARGVVLRPEVQTGRLTTDRYSDVSMVDAVATTENGTTTVFLVNRSLDQSTPVEIDLSDLGCTKVLETHLLHEDDPTLTNSADHPDRVITRPFPAELVDGRANFTLPPAAWACISLT